MFQADKAARESFYTETDRLSLQSSKPTNKYWTNTPLAIGLFALVFAVTTAIITTAVIRLGKRI
jgi:hypothetical protein